MKLPPQGRTYRIRVNRVGGTEDGLTRDGQIHVRGDIDPPEECAVRLVKELQGYAVVEVVDDVDPKEVVSLHEWREQKKKLRERSPVSTKENRTLRRRKEDYTETVGKKSWRKIESNKERNEEGDEGSEEDSSENKNDLLNGKL